MDGVERLRAEAPIGNASVPAAARISHSGPSAEIIQILPVRTCVFQLRQAHKPPANTANTANTAVCPERLDAVIE